MKIRRSAILPLVLLLAGTLSLAACSRDPASADAAGEAVDDGFIARTTRNALEAARKDIAEGNISVGGRGSGVLHFNGVTVGGSNSRNAHLPKAEISPAGDLLVGGQPVDIDERQRQLLLAHRANIVSIADAGITVGIQGAQLGMRAARGAIASVLSGTSDDFEKRMEAEGAKIEVEAQKLCDLMPALFASQQALAAALPAFEPYASMDVSDVEDCRKDVANRDDTAAEADAAAGPASN